MRPYGKNRQPVQVSLFADNLNQIEWLIDRGYAGNRSEVIRKLIAEKVEETTENPVAEEALNWFVGLDVEARLAQIRFMYEDRLIQTQRHYQAVAGE